MTYTLKICSIDWLAERTEHIAMTQKTADEFRESGWNVAIIDIPSRTANGVHRQRIEVSRTIRDLDAVRKYWNINLIVNQPARIGITFPDADIYRAQGKREVGFGYVSSFASTSGYCWDCSVAGMVEIFVDGGKQWGDENLEKFVALLDVWDKKFKVARKLKQIIGAAVSQNQGAIDRLRGEILEQVMAL